MRSNTAEEQYSTKRKIYQLPSSKFLSHPICNEQLSSPEKPVQSRRIVHQPIERHCISIDTSHTTRIKYLSKNFTVNGKTSSSSSISGHYQSGASTLSARLFHRRRFLSFAFDDNYIVNKSVFPGARGGIRSLMRKS